MGSRWRWMMHKPGRGRPFGHLHLSDIPTIKEFRPIPTGNTEPVELSYPELEAIKLADFEGLTQEQAADRMGTSRGTVWRLLTSARKKVAQALAESRPILVAQKGKVEKA
jgi:predicted DNA-binding protein (UPF0251 family)